MKMIVIIIRNMYYLRRIMRGQLQRKNSCLIKKTFLAASILVALSPTLHAETSSNKETTMFDEVVVSATRTEQSIKDTSSSISKVTSDDIEKKQWQPTFKML